MTKISILYPYTEQSRFDMDYYLKTHMPESLRDSASRRDFIPSRSIVD